VPNPPLPSGATIRYLPSVWPLKSNAGCYPLNADVGGKGEWASIPLGPAADDNRGVLARFYAPALDPRADFPLPEDEARHLTRVLRLGTGAEVAVFDGHGREYRALVVEAHRDRAVLRTIDALPAAPEPAVRITVVQAILKGGSMDEAVRDATMMGASAIVPVLTAHVDVKPAVAVRAGNADRWRRVALAAVKQCRRSTLPHIHEPGPLDAWLAATPLAARLVFVEPSAPCAPAPLKSLLEAPVPREAAVLLGPEGGWSSGELDGLLQAGCRPVSLGPLTLRAEAMPVAALAALTVVWG